MTECPNCTKPANTAVICRACLAQLRHQLSAMPDLLVDLEITTIRQDHLTPQSEIHAGPANPPLPFNPTAGQHLTVLRRSLTAWAALAHKQATNQTTNLDAERAAAYLLRTLNRHYADPWLAELATDIDRHTRRGQQLIDIPSAKAHIHVGPCPELDTEGEHCTGQIIAWFPTDPTQRPLLQCNTCETRWLPEQWHRAGLAIGREKQRQADAQTLALAIIGKTAS